MSVTGNRGRFSDRIKKILLAKQKKTNNYEIEDSKVIYANFLKVLAVIPGLIYGSLVDNTVPKKTDDNTVPTNDNNLLIARRNRIIENRKRINTINIDDIRKRQETFYNNNNYNVQNNNYNVQKNKTVKTEADVKVLEKKIINLIKKDLIRIVNEMEILQSELYILSEVNGDTIVLKDCQKELDYVKNLICKIDKLKEQYDFLKDNYDFEYLLEMGNNELVDNIIELRDTFGNNELKAVSTDYKLLDAYKYLYLKIDNLEDKMVEYEEKKKEEEQKLRERDIDFEKLKSDVYNVESINDNYNGFVRNQNELLREIDSKIAKISQHERVDYHLKGFNELFRNSFKYFGLLVISPLKGVIPSIATETLITGNLIKNLYKNLEWEETRRTVYDAIDYSSLINIAIDDLDSTGRIVDTTLDDIVHLKMKYNEKFKEYQGDFLEYQEIMHKIGDMENKILGNKIKIEMMKKRALEQKAVNDNTLKLVRDMNERENR